MADVERWYERFLRSTGAVTDTRQLLPGGMFFALKGPNFNANAFAAQALAGGCAFAVVDNPAVVSDDRFILVPDVLRALQALGHHHRSMFDVPVIGITGTNGKTTTKELMHAVLSADRPTLATSGNLNNHIGVPLTLLKLTAQHRIAIIEMGANHVGDIAELTAIAEPTHGIITNIGKAHLEGFGGVEGVVRAKTEMYDFVRAHGGHLFVHAEDVLLMEKSTGVDRTLYGTDRGAPTVGQAVSSDAFLALTFRGRDGRERRVRTELIGDYNLPNALAAIAVGQMFGVDDERIAEALSNYTPSNNRSQFTDTGSKHVVMDAYNANPSSMKAALVNFAAMKGDRPKLVIAGDMLELGAEAGREHSSIAELIVQLRLPAWLIGPEFGRTSVSGTVQHFASASEALDEAKRIALHDRLILIKGSRGMRLESLLAAL